jgi:glycosyltransferase involved in cell wall biosynthesis
MDEHLLAFSVHWRQASPGINRVQSPAALRPLRIAQIITPSKVAGAERSTLDLCRRLAARGHEVTLVCKMGHPLIDLARSQGIDTVQMKISGKLNPLAAMRLARFLHERHIDLAATQLSTASLWGSAAAKLASIPSVATVRALNTKTCFRFASRLIAVSDAVRNHLVGQGMPAERIDVVYNGIDVDHFAPTSDAATARAALGLSPSVPIIGVVAHLTKKKGHDWFLQSAARLERQRPQVNYLFLGDGPERDALRRQVEELQLGERVVFAGFQQDVRPWLAAMDVVVLPATAKEGFGRVLVEAGAMEKPVVTSQMGGVVEVVADGKSGLVVPTGSVDGLADALARLIANPALRARMGQMGRRRAVELFSVERMVSDVERVYAKLLPRQVIARAE